MNYLAHLFLSEKKPEILFSNFLTDMMTISEVRKLPPEFQKGVKLHRFIDQYTDSHSINRDRMTSLHPYFGKYASVALDVYYDYFLYKNWHQYSDIPYQQFAEEHYHNLTQLRLYIPSRLTAKVDRMIELDFLQSYITPEGIEKTFSRIDKRASFQTGFNNSKSVLLDQEEDLNLDFNSFFPDLIQASHEFLKVPHINISID